MEKKDIVEVIEQLEEVLSDMRDIHEEAEELKMRLGTLVILIADAQEIPKHLIARLKNQPD